MEKSMKLETFLAMAKERNERATSPAMFDILEFRGDDGELTDVELKRKDAFYCTDLIAVAEALELSCYISLAHYEGYVSVRVYIHH